MMMNVQKFKEKIHTILDFGIENKFGSSENTFWHDQDLMNNFFSVGPNSNQRAYLPYDWNYKVYWGSESDAGVKIVHFHGIKPGSLIECLASMDMESSLCDKTDRKWAALYPLIKIGFQEDGGRFANQTMTYYEHIVPRRPF
jgi:hypothetical protein